MFADGQTGSWREASVGLQQQLQGLELSLGTRFGFSLRQWTAATVRHLAVAEISLGYRLVS